jgi:hypothetical protein
MKNTFTLALLLVCGGTLQAQLNKGTQLLTGNFNIGASNQESLNNYDTSKSKSFGAGIGIGRQWVHKENRIRGFQIGYNYNTYTLDYLGIDGVNKRTYNSFNVGYVSQYLLPFGKKFYGTATLLSQFAFNKLKEQNENGSNFSVDGEIYTLSFGIQPGLAYQLNKRWIADVTLGSLLAANVQHGRSRSNSGNSEYKDRSTSFNLSSIFSGNSTFLGIGFRYILR